MIITVYTDASYANGLGGGAYWSRCEGAKTEGFFPIFGADCSGQAETVAALHSTILTLEDPEFALARFNSMLVIVTDCMSVKHFLERDGGSYDRNPMIKELHNAFKDLCHRYGITFKVNHVKAHTGRKDKRSWVNDRCDRHAKLGREEAKRQVFAERRKQESIERRKRMKKC